MTIPVIDAAALTGGDEQQLAVFRAKLLDGLKTYGFVKLINHTVPVPLVAETFDQVCSVPPGCGIRKSSRQPL
jgi:isopenicillin N synthase-like dioxygenase